MENNYTFLEGEKTIAAFLNEKMAAQITWSKAGDNLLIIDHTEVFDGHSGKGLGRELVRLVVEKAKNEGLKIMPLCPYAKRQFEKNPEYQVYQL